MKRQVERALVAKVGAFIFSLVLLLPASISANAARPSQVLVADVWALGSASASVTEATLFTFAAANVDLPEVAGFTRVLVPEEVEVPAAPVAAPVIVPARAPVIVSAPAVTGGAVLASWYGPGFYGNRTACGQTFTPELIGVAHLTLPCGTQVAITSPSGITVVAPVIDRGPYVGGRTLDLSSALKSALRCSDLCSVRMAILP